MDSLVRCDRPLVDCLLSLFRRCEGLGDELRFEGEDVSLRFEDRLGNVVRSDEYGIASVLLDRLGGEIFAADESTLQLFRLGDGMRSAGGSLSLLLDRLDGDLSSE